MDINGLINTLPYPPGEIRKCLVVLVDPSVEDGAVDMIDDAADGGLILECI